MVTVTGREVDPMYAKKIEVFEVNLAEECWKTLLKRPESNLKIRKPPKNGHSQKANPEKWHVWIFVHQKD